MIDLIAIGLAAMIIDMDPVADVFESTTAPAAEARWALAEPPPLERWESSDWFVGLGGNPSMPDDARESIRDQFGEPNASYRGDPVWVVALDGQRYGVMFHDVPNGAARPWGDGWEAFEETHTYGFDLAAEEGLGLPSQWYYSGGRDAVRVQVDAHHERRRARAL